MTLDLPEPDMIEVVSVEGGMKYPRVYGHRRLPKPDKDGTENHGKPCVICGANTIGEKWIQLSYMRGEDETARVCAGCWKTPDEEVIAAFQHD